MLNLSELDSFKLNKYLALMLKPHFYQILAALDSLDELGLTDTLAKLHKALLSGSGLHSAGSLSEAIVGLSAREMGILQKGCREFDGDTFRACFSKWRSGMLQLEKLQDQVGYAAQLEQHRVMAFEMETLRRHCVKVCRDYTASLSASRVNLDSYAVLREEVERCCMDEFGEEVFLVM